jgi:hypothetical protein
MVFPLICSLSYLYMIIILTSIVFLAYALIFIFRILARHVEKRNSVGRVDLKTKLQVNRI